jgi:glycosyltransferase involved in cell wall biosynthesis
MTNLFQKFRQFFVGPNSNDIQVDLPNPEFLNIQTNELPSVSVIIPCYEMFGKGAIHLSRSLEMLAAQTWKNFEVVISDHSQSDLILDCVNSFSSKLNIQYLRNDNFRGSSCENANHALNNCKNEVVKILFQDDYLSQADSLERAMKYFVFSEASWMASGCNHRIEETGKVYWNHYPVFKEDQLFDALNSLGCPSVIYVRANEFRFDRRLPALMDLDYYKQLHKAFGKPILFNEINVTIGVHDGQVTNNGGFGDKVQVAKELEIVAEKYQKVNT